MQPPRGPGDRLGSTDELVGFDPGSPNDFSEEPSPDLLSWMDWNHDTPAVGMAHDEVAAVLAKLDETQGPERTNHSAGRKWPDGGHRSDLDCLNLNELGTVRG